MTRSSSSSWLFNRLFLVFFICVTLLVIGRHQSHAFQVNRVIGQTTTTRASPRNDHQHQRVTVRRHVAAPFPDQRSDDEEQSQVTDGQRQAYATAAPGGSRSYVLSMDEIKPVLKFKQKDGSFKIMNAYGLWCSVVTFFLVPWWMLALWTVQLFHRLNPKWDVYRGVFDTVGKLWCRVWLRAMNCGPTFSGDLDRVKGQQKACLYVANHASWLDIAMVVSVIEPAFKFIAKGDLKKVPFIGHQLSGGNHILIDRDDRRSQIRTFKEGIQWLKKGVGIMAFPEGRRSDDGRLMAFKGGMFTMAMKVGVPVVPISISHAHAVMPRQALLPVQAGRGKLHLHIHSPIETNNVTSEAELEQLVRTAILSKLPLDQWPLVETVPPPTNTNTTNTMPTLATTEAIDSPSS